ncbi:MAG: hypothetical protein QW540_07355 [Archaeoglobaceae archaeon]
MEKELGEIIQRLAELETQLTLANKEKFIKELKTIEDDLFTLAEVLRHTHRFVIVANYAYPNFKVLPTAYAAIEIDNNATLNEIKQQIQQATLKALPKLISEAIYKLSELVAKLRVDCY